MTSPTHELRLPVELVSYVLSFLPPSSTTSIQTLLSCSVASRSLRQVALQSSLWRPHVAARWSHGTRCSLEDDAHMFYRYRALQDAAVTDDIESLAATSHSRLPRLEHVRERGDQVIDLLKQLQDIDESTRPETYLCERYWAQQAYRAVLRDQAIEIWRTIAEDEVEREDAFELGSWAFVAFRGFDYRDYLPNYDLDRHPNLLAALDPIPSNDDTGLRRIATNVMDHMRELGFQAAGPLAFHHINNHFLSHVWAAANTPSRGTLPMSLVSIFCSFICRLPEEFNVRAKPIGFPGVLLAGVAHKDRDDWIIINVYKLKVLEPNEVQRMLREMNLEPDEAYFRPATAKEMCFRIARNILTSVRRGDDDGITDHNAMTPSLYAVALALFHFCPPEPQSLYANWAVSIIQAEYPFDVSYLENRIVGTYSTPERVSEVVGLCEEIREGDAVEPELKEGSSRIKWRIGQVFRHRLFGYVGVIRGFDETCAANEQWIRSMGVDTLPHGRHQPFYHVITDDGGSRYVAQENIADEDHRSLTAGHFIALERTPVIGRYFRKRERDAKGRWRFIKSQETEAMYPETKLRELDERLDEAYQAHNDEPEDDDVLGVD